MSKKMKAKAPRRVFYYYIREVKERHPRITVCLALFADGILCRGIALCSFSEKEINKERGRQIAKSRALRAYKEKAESCPVKRAEADRVLASVERGGHFSFWYKSEHDVAPNEFEKRILNWSSRQ